MPAIGARLNPVLVAALGGRALRLPRSAGSSSRVSAMPGIGTHPPRRFRRWAMISMMPYHPRIARVHLPKLADPGWRRPDDRGNPVASALAGGKGAAPRVRTGPARPPGTPLLGVRMSSSWRRPGRPTVPDAGASRGPW